MNNNENRVLLVIDASNFEYVSIWSAFAEWERDYKEDCSVLVPPKETDQNNLPNILNIPSFKKVLHNTVQDKIEKVKWIAKKHHQAEIDMAEGMDIVFTEDDKLTNNFRRKLYPEYKSQRGFVRKRFNVGVVKSYIEDVIFKELELEEKHGFKIIKVEDCESDDIVAVLMKKYNDYLCRILISSDKDFLQLDGVYQYDFKAEEVKRCVYTKKQFENVQLEMTPKEYLLWKIIRGDISDNIKSVFDRYGDMKSFKLIHDIPTLKKMLYENQEAAQRFKLNKTLIDFKQIPKEMEDKITAVLDEKMKRSPQKDKIAYILDGCVEL